MCYEENDRPWIRSGGIAKYLTATLENANPDVFLSALADVRRCRTTDTIEIVCLAERWTNHRGQKNAPTLDAQAGRFLFSPQVRYGSSL